MKIALIHTARSEELKESLENSIREAFGQDTEIAEYQDLSVLQETAAAGHITAGAAARYAGMHLKAEEEGADAILSTCCVMGDAVEPLKSFLEFEGIPFASLDESFCKNALLENEKICMLATAGVAAYSVGHTFERYQRKLGRFSAVETVLVRNTAGLTGEAFYEKIWETAKEHEDTTDAFVLSQPSMAFAGEYLRARTGKRVYSAVDDAVSVLKNRVEGQKYVKH